ncbi:MAG: methyltransferase type 11, partial [Halobacteriales archaeon]|nr:methyltransferase type 11 [Halobacteriales archaeon]
MVGHVRFFERFAPVYKLVMPRASRHDIEAGLAVAERPVDRVVDVGGGTGRAVREVDARERVVLDPAEA